MVKRVLEAALAEEAVPASSRAQELPWDSWAEPEEEADWTPRCTQEDFLLGAASGLREGAALDCGEEAEERN